MRHTWFMLNDIDFQMNIGDNVEYMGKVTEVLFMHGWTEDISAMHGWAEVLLIMHGRLGKSKLRRTMSCKLYA